MLSGSDALKIHSAQYWPYIPRAKECPLNIFGDVRETM